MPMMTLNREANVFKGMCTVHFEKGVATFVPDDVVPAAMAAGAVPADAKEAKAVEKAIAVAEVTPPPVGSVKEQQIAAVMREIRDENNPEDFTATGMPNEGAVTKRLGYEISRKEREAGWKALIEKAE